MAEGERRKRRAWEERATSLGQGPRFKKPRDQMWTLQEEEYLLEFLTKDPVHKIVPEASGPLLWMVCVGGWLRNGR